MNKDASLAYARRLCRVKFLRGDVKTAEGWKKRRSRIHLIDRISLAVERAESSGAITVDSSHKEVKKAVGSFLWGPLLLRWILLPLVNHLIVYFWDKYLEGRNHG